MDGKQPAYVPIEPPTRPGQGESATARWIKASIKHLVLVGVLLFVLLPLVWMILTAFKVRGTAFRFQFIPQTAVVTPPPNEDPLAIPADDGDGALVHFELEEPAATTVEVELWQAGSIVAVEKMRLAWEGLWVANVELDQGGTTRYRFLVNDQPRPPEGAGNDGYGVFVPADDRLTVVGTPRFQVYRESGGTLNAAIRSEPGQELEIQLVDGGQSTLSLREASPGEYRVSLQDSNATAFRVVRHRSFGEAMGTLYTTRNFSAILNNPEFYFLRYFMNSLIVATTAALLTVLICTMAGYAFAAREFHYRDQLFAILLASMLVPGMIYMVPQFSITLKLGWLNSFQGLIVPHLANVFGLFLLRQYVIQIPRDLFNAAEIDGASNMQVFARIVVPVCLPIMVTLFLLTFVTQWSNFLWQLIVNTGDPATMTLPVGLQQFKGQNTNEWEQIMAGACFSIIPIAILFLSLQKYFLSGLTAGAVKE